MMASGPTAGNSPAIDGESADTALQLVLAIHRLIRSLRGSRPGTSLHPTQLLVLSALVEGGSMRIGELAARVPCSQPTATTVVTGLAAAGLVERVPDEADGRATKVELTEQGSSMIVSIARRQAALLDQRLSALSEDERALVLSAVPVLQRMALPPQNVTPCPGAAAGSADSSTTTGS